MINHVLLVGRLLGKPELRTTRGDLQVATGMVITLRERTNRGSGQRVMEQTRHRLVWFGRDAGNARNFLDGGYLVEATGRIDYRETPGRGEEPRMEVIVEGLRVLDRMPPPDWYADKGGTQERDADPDSPPEP